MAFNSGLLFRKIKTQQQIISKPSGPEKNKRVLLVKIKERNITQD